jgi:hypothetical protein
MHARGGYLLTYTFARIEKRTCHIYDAHNIPNGRRFINSLNLEKMSRIGSCPHMVLKIACMPETVCQHPVQHLKYKRIVEQFLVVACMFCFSLLPWTVLFI